MDSHLWAEVNERINAGEMPPEEQPRPNEQEISEFIAQLDQKLSEGKAARMAARPPVAHYRLSRKEYQNTVYDLLGVRYDPTKPGELNEDTLWHGYERIGSQLSLSPSHINRYYQAAEIVLDRAFPQTEGEARKIKKTAADLRYAGGEKQKEALKRFGIKRPLRYLHFPGRVQQALSSNWFGKTGPEHSGLYKLRLQASGIRPPGGQPAHLSIGMKTSEENVEGILELDVTAPEDSPQVYEAEVFLEMPTQLHFAVVATDVIDRRQGAAFRNALSLFFMKSVIQAEGVGTLYFIYFVAGLAAVPGWLWLGRKVGKHVAFAGTLITVAIISAINMFFTADDYWPFVILFVFKGACFGGLQFLPLAILADVIDVETAETGKARAGAYIAFASMTAKISTALGTFLAIRALSFTNFDAKLLSENAFDDLFVLRLLYAIAPAVFFIGAIIIALRFPLTAKVHAELQARIKSARSA